MSMDSEEDNSVWDGTLGLGKIIHLCQKRSIPSVKCLTLLGKERKDVREFIKKRSMIALMHGVWGFFSG